MTADLHQTLHTPPADTMDSAPKDPEEAYHTTADPWPRDFGPTTMLFSSLLCPFAVISLVVYYASITKPGEPPFGETHPLLSWIMILLIAASPILFIGSFCWQGVRNWARSAEGLEKKRMRKNKALRRREGCEVEVDSLVV